MKIKKAVAALAAAALLSFGALVLAGCGQDDEQVIRDGVTEELESIKNLDQETLDEFLGDADVAELEEYGVDGEAFLRSYLNGFDYSVGDVVVDGDTATVTVTLTCKSFNSIMKGMTDAMTELSEDESVLNMSEDELNDLIGKTVIESVEAVEATEKSPVDLEYQLQDNTWTATSAAEDALSAALFE